MGGSSSYTKSVIKASKDNNSAYIKRLKKLKKLSDNNSMSIYNDSDTLINSSFMNNNSSILNNNSFV